MRDRVPYKWQGFSGRELFVLNIALQDFVDRYPDCTAQADLKDELIEELERRANEL